MTIPPKFVTREDFKIQSYDIDHRKQVAVPALVKMMHEAAMTNAIDLDLSVWDLEPHGISWVLMRKKLTLHRLPDHGETITVETNAAGFERFFTYRDYKVFDAQNNLVATAATIWLLMNLETRKMTRIPALIMDRKFPILPNALPRIPFKLPPLETASLEKKFQVGWYDLDFNKHLNNLYYLQWVLETLPDNILQNYQLKEIDLLYKLECAWKEEVLCETEILGDTSFRHRMVRQSDGKEVLLATTDWQLS